MAISTKISRSAVIVILAALLMGGLSSAAWTFQDPKRPPTSEEERKRALDRITKQLQDGQPGAKPATASPVQQPQVTPASPAAAPAPPPIPAAAASAPRESGKVLLNIENADLYDFINNVSSMLNLTPLVIDSEVKGSVNLSSGSISKEDLLPLFSMILKNNNAALIRQGGTYQVVPMSSALKRGVDIIEHLPSSDGTRPETGKQPEQIPPAQVPASEGPTKAGVTQTGSLADLKQMTAQSTARVNPTAIPAKVETTKDSRLATHVVRVEFVPVKDLIEPIKLFMTEGGLIMPYERLNMLILTDYTDNVARILQIIKMLDNSYLDPDLVELVKIKNNASNDVADDLKKLFGTGAKESSTGVQFISLERLNAIFVMASSKRALEEVKGWIRELDSETAKNIQTYIYAVQNSTASNIAMMLSALYGGEGGSSGSGTGSGSGQGGFGGGVSGRSQGGSGTFGQNTNPGSSGSGGVNTPFNASGQSSYQGSQFGSGGYSNFGGGGSGYGGYGNYGGGFGSGGFGAGRQLGPQLNNNRTITSQVLRGGPLTGLQDTVRMVVDDINNSLVIQATSVDYAYLLETIKKMDVLPRQALIDARIFEVDLQDTDTLGIGAALRAKTTGNLTTGSVNMVDGALSGDGILSASTFIPIGNAREIIAALHALHTKNKVKVLEAPSVLALDGQMAQIMVGAEVPYPGTSFTPSNGGTTTSVQYRDTGVNLQVIPRISASGAVTLDLVQEVSDTGSPVNVGGETAPSFKKTSVQTTLTVKDGETVAIAGLIRDGNDLTRSGVPLLSQIPILGSLFGTTQKTSHRNELIIMITPHVVRTPEGLQEMTQELKDSLRHTRKWVDEKDKEKMHDVRDAREERAKEEKKDEGKAPKSTKPEDPGKMDKMK
jgi:general secretion pathway protein D